MQAPSPRSLVLDLLYTVGRATVPVSALVEAARLFGIADNSLRVALTRLCSDGQVEREPGGRYGLGARSRALQREVRSWRRADAGRVPWAGAWVAAHVARLSGGRGSTRRARARALRLLGFRPFAPGLELRPDNLAGGVGAVRERLAALGVKGPGLVSGLGELDPEAERVARGLWDVEALLRGYDERCRELADSARRLPGMPRGEAMVESFQLGGAAIRQLALDPLLPEAIVAPARRRALVEALRRYDRLGRDAWAGWLETDDAELNQLPAGVGDARALGAMGATV